MLDLAFDADLIEWRGPAPYVYAPLPPGAAAAVESVAKRASYGWGVIPVEATVGGITFTTSLFPRDGSYLLPLKLKVRRALGITVGDSIAVSLTIRPLTP